LDKVCLTSYFGNDHYWVDYFNKINKKINLKEDSTETESSEVKGEEVKETRRSKRRKTEQANATPKKSVKDEEAQTNTNEESNHKQILWTDKYQFLNEDEIIDNRFQLERLKQWLQKWKKLIKNTCGKQKDEDDVNYDSDSSCSSETSNFSSCSYSSVASSCSNASASGAKFFGNAILLSGPTGCGKTSSVYCVAKQLGFKVFEVNTSHLRCKSQIMQELIGSLSSHHVTSNKVKKSECAINKDFFSKEPKISTKNEEKAKNTLQNNTNKKQAAKPVQSNAKRIDSFFKTKAPNAGQIVGNENENIQSNDNAASRKRRKSVETVSSQDELDIKPAEDAGSDLPKADSDTTTKIDILKESLILFDDIEIVLKDDQGFWSVILYFIKNSKKPIILTSSDENILNKIDLNVDQIKFNKQSFASSLNYLKAISLCESINIQNDDFFINLLNRNKNDLRTSILELQFFLTSLDYDKNNGKESEISSQDKSENEKAVKEVHRSDASDSSREANDELKDYTNYFQYFGINHLINTSRVEINTNSNLNSEENSCYNDVVVTKTESGLDELDHTISTSFKSSLIFIEFKQQLIDYLVSYLSTNTNLESVYLRHYLKRNESSIDSSFKLKQYVDIVSRFSTRSNKLMSNKTLYIDYRPYLTSICKSEERKKENSKRRYSINYIISFNLFYFQFIFYFT
jgi:DNA polymerase III delta prime subunit